MTVESTYSSSIHGTLTKIDNILGQKTSSIKFKRIQILQVMFSGHNGINLEINKGKSLNIWKWFNKFLNKTWNKKEIKSKLESFELNENKSTIENVFDASRGKFIVPRTILKIKINNHTFYLRN